MMLASETTQADRSGLGAQGTRPHMLPTTMVRHAPHAAPGAFTPDLPRANTSPRRCCLTARSLPALRLVDAPACRKTMKGVGTGCEVGRPRQSVASTSGLRWDCPAATTTCLTGSGVDEMRGWSPRGTCSFTPCSHLECSEMTRRVARTRAWTASKTMRGSRSFWTTASHSPGERERGTRYTFRGGGTCTRLSGVVVVVLSGMHRPQADSSRVSLIQCLPRVHGIGGGTLAVRN